jgi:hypothetical protein
LPDWKISSICLRVEKKLFWPSVLTKLVSVNRALTACGVSDFGAIMPLMKAHFSVSVLVR